MRKYRESVDCAKAPAGTDEATRFTAMMTRIRVDGGVTDHVAMGLSQRHSDVISVPTASVGDIVMVPADDAGRRGPSAESMYRRRDPKWGAPAPPPSAFEVGSFGVPFRAPGPPVLCRIGCGRAGFDQSHRGADICCTDCWQGAGHSRWCDAKKKRHPSGP